jgi:hypothetical protein
VRSSAAASSKARQARGATLRLMCAQCMAAAATAAAGATGIRAWLATRGWSWLTPQRLRRATAALFAVALVAAATLSGAG